MREGRRRRILILGGGFGGVYTAIALEKFLRRDPIVEIALVSKENYLVFQPMLPEIISGSIGILDTITPIRRLCRGSCSPKCYAVRRGSHQDGWVRARCQDAPDRRTGPPGAARCF
jgi:hypothetical protein